jgi:hypothetical protein
MTLMTPKERALYDARAKEEAWEFALSILYPWVDAARPIGSEELTRVMEGALAEAEQELDRAADERRAAKAAL